MNCKFSQYYCSSFRTNYVLERADLNQIEMEASEAKDIAKDEVIYILCEEERNKKRSEIEANIAEMKKREREEILKKQQSLYGYERKMNEGDAAFKIGLASRRWLARKQTRELLSEVYEKDYSDEYNTFYYRHKKTVRYHLFSFSEIISMSIFLFSSERYFMGKTSYLWKIRYTCKE